MYSQSVSSPTDRWEISPPGIDEAELVWWEEFSDIQNTLAWVQTPEIRQILRRPYLDALLSGVQKNASIVELGCGTGWLLGLLAARGCTKLIGIDFSPKQLEISRRESLEQGWAEQASFFLPSELPSDTRADVVICHGFLHHLTKSEIRSVLEQANNLLLPCGHLLIFEPVDGVADPGWWMLPAKISLLFSGWGGIRPMSTKEKAIRELADRMNTAPREPGRGPSPKEMPFKRGEIEDLVSGYFATETVQPYMYFSWTVAARLLLFSATFPRLGKLITSPFLHLMSAWEQFSLHHAPPELWHGWNFCLFKMRKSHAS